jgi:hypothetical protein
MEKNQKNLCQDSHCHSYYKNMYLPHASRKYYQLSQLAWSTELHFCALTKIRDCRYKHVTLGTYRYNNEQASNK